MTFIFAVVEILQLYSLYEGIFCREEGDRGGGEKKSLPEKTPAGICNGDKSYFAKLTDLVSRITVILTCPG